VTLTTRELQVADLIADGMSDRQVGHELGITFNTARTHARNVMGKLYLTRRSGMARALEGCRG
jgi:DNA-binding NarL/FixJ family response regulator